MTRASAATVFMLALVFGCSEQQSERASPAKRDDPVQTEAPRAEARAETHPATASEPLAVRAPEPEPIAEPLATNPLLQARMRQQMPRPRTSKLRIEVARGRSPAVVYVDGEQAPNETPVTVAVCDGPHLVRWKWDDGESEVEKVSVVQRQTLTVVGGD